MLDKATWFIGKQVKIIESAPVGSDDKSLLCEIVESKNKNMIAAAKDRCSLQVYSSKLKRYVKHTCTEVEVENGLFIVEVDSAPDCLSQGGRSGGCGVKLSHPAFPNKKWRISISIDNLFDVIKTTTIVKGIVQSKMWYARYNGAAVLLPSGSKILEEALSSQSKRDNRKTTSRKYPGMIYNTLQKSEVYMGEVYVMAKENVVNGEIRSGSSSLRHCRFTVYDIGDTAVEKRFMFEPVTTFKEIMNQSSDKVTPVKCSEYIQTRIDKYNDRIRECIKDNKTYGRWYVTLPEISDPESLMKNMPSREIVGTAIELDKGVKTVNINEITNTIINNLLVYRLMPGSSTEYLTADEVVSLLALSTTPDRQYTLSSEQVEQLMSIVSTRLVIRYNGRFYYSPAAKKEIVGFKFNDKMERP